MTHHFQIIVAPDVGPTEVDALGERAVEWLNDEHVIDDAPTQCVCDPSASGYRPGPAWQSAIVELDEYFLELDVNGMQVERGRTVFDAGAYAPTPHCPQCNQPRRADPDWQRAVDAWRAGDDTASLRCPRCSGTSPLVDWRHDPPIAFGHLGFRFWNWPSINREFIERLSAELAHRLVLVEGRAD